MKVNVVLVAALGFLMSACSTIVEGTSQDISVNTDPEGADCGLHREGVVIGRINPTPGTVEIDKTKYDIIIKCNKAGFHETQYFNKSDVAGATAGNIILGGGVGWIIDSSVGADNKYDSNVYLELVPESEPKPEPVKSRDDNPKAPGEEEDDSSSS